MQDREIVIIGGARTPMADYVGMPEGGKFKDITAIELGAIALGHPLGMTGTRLTYSLLLELRRRNLRYGLATACTGGGQGVAVILEALNS